jgi:YfiH family protein
MRAARIPAFEAVPGLEHGFERRRAEPGAESRDATRARVSAALAGSGELLLLSQVHGDGVCRAPWSGRPAGDAAVVAEPGQLVGIETADCLPLLLVDPEAGVAGAAHAGWRGTAAGVASRTVAAMLEAGARPERLLAGVGPGIGLCCYAVGPELREAFGASGGDLFVERPGGATHLDLREANRRQLVAAGVPPAAVHHVGECTACRPEDYHSYRRDGAGSGRMLSWIGWGRERP